MKTGDDGNGGPKAGTLTSENTVILKKIREFLDWIAASVSGNYPEESLKHGRCDYREKRRCS